MNQMMSRRCGVWSLAVAMTLLSGWSSQSVAGPEAASLKFGMSTALTGPAADLGRNMKAGVDLAFAEANAAGGLQGRRLELVALDDGYEPSRTAPNMRQLIEGENVLAVIGNVGTPTAVVAVPIAIESKTPFYGAYTGAGVLRRQPPNRYVINYRASYAEETAAMVEALIVNAGLRPEEVAFFTQRDAYGDAGLYGGLSALRRHGLSQVARVAHGRYERNTLAVENGLADILQANESPKAIILVGAYAPCAKFIRLAQSFGVDAIFLNVSFVGSNSLAEELGADGEGVIITQVVPHYDSDLQIVKEYRAALETHAPALSPSFGGLEGYIATRTLLLALGRLEEPPTRESIIDAVQRLGQFDIGLGQQLQVSASDHQASHFVWPTIIRDGVVEPCDWGVVRERAATAAAGEADDGSE